MTLQIADLLAIAGIIALPLLPFVVAGALALLKSAIQDLRTETRADIERLRTEGRADRKDLRAEIRAVNAEVESLAQAICTSSLVRATRWPPRLNLALHRPQLSAIPLWAANALPADSAGQPTRPYTSTVPHCALLPSRTIFTARCRPLLPQHRSRSSSLSASLIPQAMSSGIGPRSRAARIDSARC